MGDRDCAKKQIKGILYFLNSNASKPGYKYGKAVKPWLELLRMWKVR